MNDVADTQAHYRAWQDIRERMHATGVGYAGIDGAWWLPATQPFVLPAEAHDELQRIAESTFALFDTVTDGYEDGAQRVLLDYKVPAHLRRFISKQRVLSVRPDFQLQLQRSERSAFVTTELEICPSAQGYAHAMQVGYGLDMDLVAAFASMLAGRELVIVMTREWSEFVWEQLAFCRALAAHGVRGRVWLDCPIEQLHGEVQRGLRWQPPMFGVSEKPPSWNDDVLDRLRAFDDVLLRDLPATGDGLALFRFGYLDCFSQDVLERLVSLEASGAMAINPMHFTFDSKAVLTVGHAFRGVSSNPKRHATEGVPYAAIPETRVLMEEEMSRFVDEKDEWVLKFAGFDRGQQAWGGRSLQVGARMSRDEWMRRCVEYCDLPFPVVAQRATPTATLDIDYFGAAGDVHTLHGNARIRSFFVRDADGGNVRVCGTHLTVSTSTNTDGVSEGTGAVQAPIVLGSRGHSRFVAR